MIWRKTRTRARVIEHMKRRAHHPGHDDIYEKAYFEPHHSLDGLGRPLSLVHCML